MSYHVYILQSKTTAQFYVGHTDNINRRINQHNDPDYHGSKHTKRNKGPWVCVYSEEFKNRSDAMIREKQIKSMKSKRYLEFLINSWQSPEGDRD